ncbi:hypothetical protein [Prescottella agglutinans]|uniref:Uncharacterized protein n=1 Tax=Prescottella agglutinans TaxID=1644129 RepID=A0ABT6M5E9_9NOCA|nr:hypothetical protein [Prescottella agglutinans]MDH6279529.1 hypothetical protein [Prescottella agglutinans]
MPTIIPTSPDQTADIARRLLAAAESPAQVVTVTAGSTMSFSVSDDVAERAGFGGAESLPEPESEPKEPPRSGKGSGEAVWQAFLAAQGIEFPADAERGELIALWDAHKDA